MAFKEMVGQKVPNVTFHTRQDGEWVDVTTDELFDGKKVVLFSLPGAFTPTCSSMHLPRYCMANLKSWVWMTSSACRSMTPLS